MAQSHSEKTIVTPIEKPIVLAAYNQQLSNTNELKRTKILKKKDSKCQIRKGLQSPKPCKKAAIKESNEALFINKIIQNTKDRWKAK